MKYIKKTVLAIVVSISPLFISAVLTTRSASAIVAGTYSYDPRQDQPSPLIVKNRPEVVLLATLQQQIARDGTYPKSARTRVTNIEPIKVVLYLRTGWHAAAQVTVNLSYDDGTEQSEVFSFHSINSKSLEFPILPDLALHNTFGRLTSCWRTTPTTSTCPVY